jgi:hypothetical protein
MKKQDPYVSCTDPRIRTRTNGSTTLINLKPYQDCGEAQVTGILQLLVETVLTVLPDGRQPTRKV